MERFWDHFVEHVRKKGIKEHVVRWYVKRAEQYLTVRPFLRRFSRNGTKPGIEL
jgi:hypothetical protein